MQKFFYIYKTKIGNLAIAGNVRGITNICSSEKLLTHNMILNETDIIKTAAAQLEQYLNGKRKEFNVPLSLDCTGLKKDVYNELIKIPFGKTISYKQIAYKIGRPTACRAVGNAVSQNPIWIIIPCHRVIGSDGSLTGYAGGLEMKRNLLKLEKIWG